MNSLTSVKERSDIGIIGKGILGTALYKDFKNKGVSVVCYDKYKNIGSVSDVCNSNIVFLCLPTPYKKEIEKYDITEIENVCNTLQSNKYNGLVVLKSTTLPQTTQNLCTQYSLNIVHNPEFLTARTALQDFENQKHIVIGLCESNKDDTLHSFYKKHYPNSDISVVSSTESELMKLAVNNFYATKIQFFNEVWCMCDSLNIEYNSVKNLMLKNGWINPMHTNVPGPDNKLSFGGMCFPKDVSALVSYCKRGNVLCEVIEATLNERNKMRVE